MPKDWHHAIILPLLKPGKIPTNPESYRPISLTPTICKVMETMVTKRLQWFLEKNNLISKNQSGFRKHRCTSDQILKLQDTILKKLKNKEHVLAIFIDFERAYDMLHVPTLLKKIQNLGIVGNTYDWVENFLSHRSFQVKVGAELSDIFLQENGTPQGSVISPLLFLLMINDIPNGIDGVEMSLFADDSAIYVGHRNVKILKQKIQLSMNIINNWCNKNGFKISINKTTGVLFSKRSNLSKIDIKIEQQLIKMEDSVKFLGVIFDSKLNWKAHIDYIIEKCKKRLNLMRAISGNGWGACKKTLLTIYKALIRSILDYGDVAYSSACKRQLDRLSGIQIEALRLCCGAPKGTSASALQNECGEFPLHLRRLENSLKFGTKITGSKMHPSAAVMDNHWTNVYKTSDSTKSIFTRTCDFFSTNNASFVGPSFPSAPPWCNKQVEVDLSLTKLVNKRTDNPEFLKLAALELMSKYSSYVHVYTDGSKVNDLVGAAFTVPSLNVDKKLRLHNDSSIYAAELTAILEAVSCILNSECYSDCQFAIFSNSLSVLTSIKKGYCESRPVLFNNLLFHLGKLKCNQVRFIWIPSHVDLIGNDRADTLAKEALNIDHINSTDYIEFQEMCSLIKVFIVNKWQLEYSSDNRGHFYKSICPVVNTSIKYMDPYYRHKEVQISRLRLGVANTNQRLFLMKRHSNGLCDNCQVKDTIQHLLFECKKEDISDLLRNKCHIYKNEVSVKTLLSVSIFQNEVYRIVKLITGGKML